MRQTLPLLQRTSRLLSQNAILSTLSTTFRPSAPSRRLATLLARASPKPAPTRPSARSSPLQQLRQLLSSTPRATLRSRQRFFTTTRPRLTQPVPPDAAEPTSLSARMRKLSREYGWSVFGVYMALTALDFPFCFLAVRWLGTERIGAWEHAVVEWVKRAVPIAWPGKLKRADEGTPEGEAEAVGLAPQGWDHEQKGDRGEGEGMLVYDHGVEEAERENMGDNASLWTQLALAYAIHKSFIFVRVPLTAAITPKVVRTLRGWGWNIGRRTPKAEREARRAERAVRRAVEKAKKE